MLSLVSPMPDGNIGSNMILNYLSMTLHCTFKDCSLTALRKAEVRDLFEKLSIEPNRNGGGSRPYSVKLLHYSRKAVLLIFESQAIEISANLHNRVTKRKGTSLLMCDRC